MLAGTGILVNDHLTGSSSTLMFNSDYVAAGDGTFTVIATKALSTANGDLLLTAWDIDLPGDLDTGTKSISVHGAKVGQSLGFGVSQNMHLTDDELSHITSTSGLTFGGSLSGNLHVSGITDTSSDSVATITLLATKHAALVQFDTAASVFNKGILVQAMGGVVVSTDVTTTSSQTVMQTGTGTMTVASGAQLSTSSNLLTLTIDDISLTGAISTGTTTVVVECTTAGRTIGLGSAPAELMFGDAELGQITATGMTVGGTNCGSQTVTGITETNSDGISTILTLLASRDDAQVTFTGDGSTFNILSVEADDGVLIKTKVLTFGGPFFMDSNINHAYDSSDAANNVLGFTDGQTVFAHTVLTLSSYQGSVTFAGTATLSAGSGIFILDHVKGVAASKPIVINADYESHGDGTLTIMTGSDAATIACWL